MENTLQMNQMLRVSVEELSKELARAVTERDRAIRSLVRTGFQDLGGEEWKPPIGKNPLIEKDLREELARVTKERDKWHQSYIHVCEASAETYCPVFVRKLKEVSSELAHVTEERNVFKARSAITEVDLAKSVMFDIVTEEKKAALEERDNLRIQIAQCKRALTIVNSRWKELYKVICKFNFDIGNSEMRKAVNDTDDLLSPLHESLEKM
jgi:hypothetical protein